MEDESVAVCLDCDTKLAKCECSQCEGTKANSSVFELVAEAALVTLGSWKFDRLFHNKYCGVLFQCGCTWDWDGGWKNCEHDRVSRLPVCAAHFTHWTGNVHNPTGPHCPWCATVAGTWQRLVRITREDPFVA